MSGLLCILAFITAAFPNSLPYTCPLKLSSATLIRQRPPAKKPPKESGSLHSSLATNTSTVSSQAAITLLIRSYSSEVAICALCISVSNICSSLVESCRRSACDNGLWMIVEGRSSVRCAELSLSRWIWPVLSSVGWLRKGRRGWLWSGNGGFELVILAFGVDVGCCGSMTSSKIKVEH